MGRPAAKRENQEMEGIMIAFLLGVVLGLVAGVVIGFFLMACLNMAGLCSEDES